MASLTESADSEEDQLRILIAGGTFLLMPSPATTSPTITSPTIQITSPTATSSSGDLGSPIRSESPDADQFKVLIAGGSLVGLALALALERAGIDYELFEKGDFAPQLGASIGFHPHTIKILEQLGVWEDIEKQVVPLRNRNHYDGNGHCFEESHVLADIGEILHRPIIFMERCKALAVLHSHVIDKSKLHSRNAVVGYEEYPQGVIVTTEDGEEHYGQILIGADGTNSKVRELMAEKISIMNQSLSKQINEAFTSEYNCIFAISWNGPEKTFLSDGMVHSVYYNNYSVTAAAGVHGLVFWFLFIKSNITRYPDFPRLTDEDAETFIQKYGSSLVGPGYTVQDLWDARVKATVAPLEEGIIGQWSHNRVVMIGDSVHKATINPGLGGNLAYEGVARFMNGLVPLLKENPAPSLEQLAEVFNRYMVDQKSRAKTVVGISGQITRYEAQDAWFLKFASRHIVPWVSDRLKASLYVGFSRGGPWLEYLPLPATAVDLTAPPPKGPVQARNISPKLVAGTILSGAVALFWLKYYRNRH
ncbi:hypothetical protein N7495_000185 [Penicillium taxi]|uniref:uncharacterized protein n=1 Tax=Penicillium taxi TaxID=168475 RepID=UPI0025451150|nr:uncharacterized protein N7495_000185 [Penicillium taxi]KAJ5907503.1 hypothetical protein N7495_000185 [Penicillium taxi]